VPFGHWRAALDAAADVTGVVIQKRCRSVAGGGAIYRG